MEDSKIILLALPQSAQCIYRGGGGMLTEAVLLSLFIHFAT